MKRVPKGSAVRMARQVKRALKAMWGLKVHPEQKATRASQVSEGRPGLKVRRDPEVSRVSKALKGLRACRAFQVLKATRAFQVLKATRAM